VWEVKLTVKAEEELRKNVQFGKINGEDINIIKAWINQIEKYGPKYIQSERKWDDHKLHGLWEGFRSSCFSGSGRIIYKIIEKRILVEVVRVTPDHNYGSF
jgi:mRNA-degrading endonuclease YafQ of YafQ-DinJ toxin-antitoxin module